MSRLTKKRLKEIEQLETKNTKYCTICKKIKPLYGFAFSAKERKFANSYCLKCTRDKRLQQEYGIGPKEYEKLFKKQSGQCAICGRIDSGDSRSNYFCVDHDHKTRKIRGLLCSSCNLAIGLLSDDPRTLIAAANYLMQTEEN